MPSHSTGFVHDLDADLQLVVHFKWRKFSHRGKGVKRLVNSWSIGGKSETDLITHCPALGSTLYQDPILFSYVLYPRLSRTADFLVRVSGYSG